MTPEEIHAALLNWGRWSSARIVNLDIPAPPAFAHWLPKNDWDSGWGDHESAPTTPPEPYDEIAAIRIDRLLIKLPVIHWYQIRRHYYQHRLVDKAKLDAACRALNDLAEA